MSTDKIREKFDNISLKYDRQREKLIPCFKDFYSIALSMFDPKVEAPKVLDLGAGTGLFSSFLLKKIPSAELTLIDISKGMLDVAKERFKKIKTIEYINDDYLKYNFLMKYDIIISSLSIHHLIDEDKIILYKKICSILKFNGIFLNCDQVLGNTEYLDRIYKSHWKNSIEKSGLEKSEINLAYDRIKLDNEAPLFRQLSWMSDAGFYDVDCIYKYYHFAVMHGRKFH